MPRSSAPTRRKILDAAYALFFRHGFARVGIDQIAAAAAVTKRTLYYHFKSKDELIAAMLREQHKLASATVQTWISKLDGDPEQVVRMLFSELAKWSAKPRWAGSGFTRVAMELADLPGHPARDAAHAHKATIETHFADVFAAAGLPAPKEKAREVWLLAEGATALILIHRDPSYAATASAAAIKLLRAGPARRRR